MADNEIAQKEAAVAAQGDAVRELKANGGSGEEIKAAVDLLISYKRELAEAKGEPFEEPSQGKKKGKKKGKGGGGGGNGGGESKKERRQRERREAEAAQRTGPTGLMADLIAESPYGSYQIVRSESTTARQFVEIKDLSQEHVGQEVWVRGFLQANTSQGGGVFMVLREALYSIQGVMFKGGDIPNAMVKWAGHISKESVIDVLAEVTAPPEPIERTSIKDLELQVKRLYVVNRSASEMPFQIEDASQVGTGDDDQFEVEAAAAGNGGEGTSAAEEGERVRSNVLQDTRLNNRWIDLRTRANQGIFRLQSATCKLYREAMLERGFTEIHTPKLLGTASEGGADVFRVDYFGGYAYLAQSPQLYKQMAIMCGLERVFEIGPVFRAENSNTNRHLTEFVGMDFEMAFKEDYHEVLLTIESVFRHIFDGLGSEEYAPLIAAVQEQHPFEPLEYWTDSTLMLKYPEAIELLREAGVEIGDLEDMDTPTEKLLGSIVKEKYKTDFFILDKFPAKKRPFYTMVDPENSDYSNSYDLFIRGQEVMSGAQRVHDSEMLLERANSLGVDLSPIYSYVDSFRNGAPLHGGGGIGLERVVMLYLGLTNIRKTCMFPRDPKRLHP